MKKSLIALAVLAASGVAMAQSSVTLYGVADLSLAKTNAPLAGNPTRTAFQMSGSGTMNNGTSRLGVRGVEDLGGGLKASFNFEHGLNMENGAGNLSGGQMWSRAAWMALQGGFGRVQMGRTLTPSFYGIAAWELTGTANYSAVGTQFNFAGAGPRDSSVLQYSFAAGGFSTTLGYIFKPDNGNNSKTDLNAVYKQGPLAVALSYNKTSNVSGSNYALGANYDFGAFKVAGSIQNPRGNSKGFTLGASVPVGPVALTLDIARENGTSMKNTDFVMEAKYALSKRTFAYAVYYKDGFAGLGNGAGGTGYNTGAKDHFGLGVRHNF